MSALGDRLRAHPADGRAMYADDRWWTYGELRERAAALALDVAPGEVVALVMARGPRVVVGVVAAALAGAVPAMIDPEDRELAQRTLARLRPRIVMHDETLERRADAIARPELALVVFTSGSTADAKGVAWSEARMLHDWEIAPAPLHLAGPSGICVPLSTALGLQEALRGLYHGLPFVLLATPFPLGLAQMQTLGVNRIKLTPSHVDILLATAHELPALAQVLVAAAPIRPARLRQLAAKLPHARVGRVYGLTESGAATIIWARRNPRKLASVGRPIGGRRIELVDGEIVIHVPGWSAGDGYIDAPPALAARFANGILRTGDRGKLDGRGFLHVGARLAEILKVGGRSVGAVRIEEALRGETSLRLAVVGVPDAALGEVPCAIYVPTRRHDPREIAKRAPRSDERPGWVLPRHGLPRTPTNKLRRGLLAREATRWAATWTASVTPDHRRFPAYELAPNVMVVDVGFERWIARALWRGRLIVLAQRRPCVALALAYLEAGRAARFVLGPYPLDGELEIADGLLETFTGELVRLAGLLPGRESATIYARPDRVATGFAAAGFRTATPPGWHVRGPALANEARCTHLDAIVARFQRRSAGTSR